jgi:hypothetical protein
VILLQRLWGIDTNTAAIRMLSQRHKEIMHTLDETEQLASRKDGKVNWHRWL